MNIAIAEHDIAAIFIVVVPRLFPVRRKQKLALQLGIGVHLTVGNQRLAGPILNITAHVIRITDLAIGKGLATFRSVKRRMDVKGEVCGVLVVDDFAHHPTAVRVTIEAARGRWPGRRLWAILEPRSNSMRRKIFEETLPVSLALADRVVLGGVFRAHQLGDENRMKPEAVAESVRALGKDAHVLGSSETIVEFVASEAAPGDVLLVMSNGSFDGLCEKLVKKLESGVRTPAEATRR